MPETVYEIASPQSVFVAYDEKTGLQTSSKSPAYSHEEEILKLSGLELNKDIYVFDVPIDSEGLNYIHTYKCGEQNRETLVLIHGYGGSSILYFPMLKELAKKYRVFCLDLPGMGLSSRPKFECTNVEETIEYFVSGIEKWREAMNIDTFYLAGHSFGGYMSTQYTAQYKDRVKKLFLLSAVGITKHEKIVTPEEFAKDLSWFRKKLYKMSLGFWKSQKTPGDYLKSHPKFGKCLMKTYLKKQFNRDGKSEKLVKLLNNYFSELYKLESGSDKAIFFVLQPPRAFAVKPLEEILDNELHMPITCYFGDKDWMDQTGAHRILSNGKRNFKIKQIDNSGHQITMHNPEMLVNDLLVELEN